MEYHLQRRRAAAILFSLIMSCVLGLGGFLAGSSLWDHWGPSANDPDDTDAYLCGVLVGSVTAMSIFGVLLWKLWPAPYQKD